MLLNLGGRVMASCMFVTGLVLHQPDTAIAQPEGQLSQKPIAIFYAKDMSETRISMYAMNLSERMDFAEAFRREVAQEVEAAETDPAVSDSMDGYLMYLVSGPIPDIETLTFCSVADFAAARRMIQAGVRDYGNERSVLIDRDNDCFIVERTSKSTSPFPEGGDEAEIAGIAETVTTDGVTRTSYEMKRSIEEKDGTKLIVNTTTHRSFHRVHDQFLYEGESEKLFAMTLPSSPSQMRRFLISISLTAHCRLPPTVCLQFRAI